MSGEYEIHYQRADGSWWIGHHGIALKDPEAYATRLAKHVGENVSVRVVDVDTREVFSLPGVGVCSVCGEPHEGRDGACLL